MQADCAARSAKTEFCLAQAPTQPPTPEPDESQGNDTLKLASLGVVFLLIGAAVVYAPQIVAGVSSLPRRLTGRPPRKAPTPKTAKAPGPRPESLPTITIEQATRPPPPVVPIDAPLRADEPDDVVRRLQNEVRSTWRSR